MEKTSYEVTRELKKSGVTEFLAFWNGKQMASAYIISSNAFKGMDHVTVYDGGEKLIQCMVDSTDAMQTVYRMLSKLVIG